METFSILQPASPLAPFVKHYWLLKTVGISDAVARTVPTGMMNLIFHRGARLLSVHENQLHPRAFLSGQEKTFADLKYEGEINMISVVFRSVGVRAFFRFPIDRVTGLRATAGDLEDKEFLILENELTSTSDDAECIRQIGRASCRERVYI